MLLLKDVLQTRMNFEMGVTEEMMAFAERIVDEAKIQDEIETGLRYYQAAFFEVIPQVNAEVRSALQARWPDAGVLEEPILRPGSWIGGDRDGNPFVTADVLVAALGVVDLDGKMLLPGFHDSHVHLMSGGRSTTRQARCCASTCTSTCSAAANAV